MGRERTEVERQAAEEFAEAVRREAARFFDVMLQDARRDREAFHSRREPLTEEEADELALSAVHRDREERPEEPEDRAPSEAELKAWSEDRERGRTEGRTARAWRL